jgi:hypothetical protein
MTDEKNLISLKEAAQKTGYSADYIGQLIRAGKIAGKQVYTNISWMTTEEAVLNYKNRGKDQKMTVKDEISLKLRKIGMEIDIVKLFFQTFRSSLPLLLVIVASFIMLSSYILYISFGANNANNSTDNQKNTSITF